MPKRVDGGGEARQVSTNVFPEVRPVSRLGRIAVSTFTPALAARAVTPATFISTTTGMTTTGPSRAGTG
jgi:hypothetical protein